MTSGKNKMCYVESVKSCPCKINAERVVSELEVNLGVVSVVIDVDGRCDVL